MAGKTNEKTKPQAPAAQNTPTSEGVAPNGTTPSDTATDATNSTATDLPPTGEDVAPKLEDVVALFKKEKISIAPADVLAFSVQGTVATIVTRNGQKLTCKGE